MHKDLAIAIVGFGFSGIAALYSLIERAKGPIKIYILDDSPSYGKGVAFATEDAHHLLNVRAFQMGAKAKEPHDFYEWLMAHENKWRYEDVYFQNLVITRDAFLPRKLYAIYLKDLLFDTRQRAKEKGIELIVIPQRAVEGFINRDKIELSLGDNTSISIDKLILATGAPVSKRLSFETDALLSDRRYIENFWNVTASHLDEMCTSIQYDRCIAIIGTGLTMVDAVTTLNLRGYDGNIIAFSPRGDLPAYHLKVPSDPIPQSYAAALPKRLRMLFHLLKTDIEQACSKGGDFRPFIDALRPVETMLWQQFSLNEKKSFFRHLFGLWNKRRHRMSFESYQLLQKLQSQEALAIKAGKIQHIDSLKDSLVVHYKKEQEASLQTLKANWVIKCSGPEYNIFKNDNGFIHNLQSQGLIAFDSLGLGLALEQNGGIKGKVPSCIFALGALLFGELFETTAVPEIREQAEKIALAIIP